MSNVFNKWAYKQHVKTGTSTNAAVSTVKTGEEVPMDDVEDGTLSAYLSVAIVTASFTLTPKWLVSKDNSTWLDCKDENNTATTAITATATKVLTAPAATNGWPYCAFALVTGGATGSTGDTYDIRYCYRYRANPA